MRGRVIKKIGLLALLAIVVVACTKEVKAVYYPDRSDLTLHVTAIVGSADECRAWVSQQAARHDDRNLRRGDYVCLVDGEKVR